LNQQVENQQKNLDIREILFIIKKHLKLIIVLSIVCGIIGFMVSKYIMKPEYQSDATLIVNADQTQQSTIMTQDQITTAQDLVNTYAVILKSDTILSQVINNLNLNLTADELSGEVTVSGVNETQVLDISVKDNNPKIAAYIANEITKIAPNFIIKTVKAGSVEIISSAKVNNAPVSPNIKLNTVISFMVGLIVSILLSFLIQKLDNSFTSEEDIQKYLDITVLGIIPNVQNKI
jgi:capsular polysaccharide biosynthesis protein